MTAIITAMNEVTKEKLFFALRPAAPHTVEVATLAQFLVQSTRLVTARAWSA